MFTLLIILLLKFSLNTHQIRVRVKFVVLHIIASNYKLCKKLMIEGQSTIVHGWATTYNKSYQTNAKT